MRGINYFYLLKTEAQGNFLTWPRSFEQEVKSKLKNLTQINKHAKRTQSKNFAVYNILWEITEKCKLALKEFISGWKTSSKEVKSTDS